MWKPVFTLLCLLTASSASDSKGVTKFDGVSSERTVESIRFPDGKGALFINSISRPYSSDYFFMLWLKIAEPQKEERQWLLDFTSGLGVYLERSQLKIAQGGSSLTLQTSGLQAERWVHLAVGGSESLDKTYATLSYNDQTLVSGETGFFHINMGHRQVYLGNSQSVSESGFIGNVREFLLADQYVQPENVINIRNQKFQWTLKVLAYYRFRTFQDEFYQNRQAVKMNSARDLLNFPVPEKVSEQEINDICLQPIGSLRLPYLEYTDSFPTYQFGLKYARRQTDYGYTASAWVKFDPNSPTEGSAFKAVSRSDFMRLGEVFYCYLSSPGYFACLIESRYSYQAKQTAILSVPTGQWVNIQLAFSRYGGYQLKVYNYLRQEMQSAYSSKALGVQKPDGKLFLFDKFVGQVRDFALFETRLSLPIVTPAGAGSNTDMYASSLLFYINMDESNFNEEGNRLFGADEKRTIGISVNRALDFEYVSWSDEYEFGGTYTDGTLNSQSTLFDGLACDDLDLTPQTQGTEQTSLTYFIPHATEEQDRKLDQMSIQFWFMQEKNQESDSTLFQMKTGDNLYMTVELKGGKLLCQPQEKSGTLEFKHFSPTIEGEKGKWYNVMCMFSETVQNFGTLYALDNLNIYSGPLTTFQQFVSAEYEVSLGNNIAKTMPSQYTFFKEVRIYSQTFETEEIKKTLFTQLSTNPATLLSYMRLNSGGNYFYDQVSIQQKTSGIDILNKTPDSADKFQVCPVHTYFSVFKKGVCLQNPFTEPKIFAFFSSTSELTISALYSNMLANEAHLTYSWQTSYPALFNLQLKDQINNGELKIKTDRINGQGYGDQLQYTWDLEISNELRSFQVSQKKSFAVKRCRWLADSETNESQVISLLPNVRGKEDIEFSFEIKEREDEPCDEGGFYEMLKEVRVELYPSELYLSAGLTLDQVISIELAADEEMELEEPATEEPSEEEPPEDEKPAEGGEQEGGEEEKGEQGDGELPAVGKNAEEESSGPEKGEGTEPIPDDSSNTSTIEVPEQEEQPPQDLQIEEEEKQELVEEQQDDEEQEQEENEVDQELEKDSDQEQEIGDTNQGRRLQAEKGYVITLKKQFQVLLDLKQPFYIVATFDYQKSEEEPDSIAQQSIGYQLEFVHSILTIVKTEDEVLLNGEELFIDGSETFLETDLNQATNQQGISFEWQCDQDFQKLCQSTFGNQLTVSFEQFQKLTSSNYDTVYTFKLIAWHTSDFERRQEFEEEVTVTWLDYEFPIFKLTDWGKPFSYTADVNVLEILLENYSFLDPNLEITWTVEPEVSAELLEIAPDKAQLFLNEGAIVSDQEYTITAVVKNTLAEKSQTTKQYVFTSNLAPQPGQLVLEPNSGIRSETVFTLKIQRWTSSNPNQDSIKFRVWTTMPDIYGNQDFLVQLSKDWIPQSGSYDTLFPYLTEIIYEVTDAGGSSYFDTRAVVMEEPFAQQPRENFNTEMAEIAELAETDLEQAFFKLKLLSYSLRQFDVINGEETYRNQENRQNILEFYQKYLQGFEETTIGKRTEIILKGVLEGLPFIFNSYTWINDRIMNQGIQVLESLKVPKIEWNKLVVQEVYRNHYLEAFNNIMGYVQLRQISILENSSNGRRLQIDQGTTSEEDIVVAIRKLLEVEKLFIQSQCENIPVGQLWQTRTDQSETQLLKFSYDSVQETQAFSNHEETIFTVLPVKKAIESLPEDGQVFCLQASFFKIDPLLGTEIGDLESRIDDFMQTNYIVGGQEYLIDNLFPKAQLSNTALQEEEKLVVLRESQTAYFTFNYEENEIRKNQTMCMYLVINNQEATWVPDNCLTTYLFDSNQVKCQCQSIGANSYLSLIRNSTRIEIDPKPVEEEEVPTYIFERDEKIYIIIVFFLAMMVPGICCCWCIDSIDYNHVQEELQDNEDVLFFTKLAKIRKQAYEVVIYKKYIATVFRSKEEEKLQGTYLFFTLLKNLHPFFSLFMKFDSRHRRITRLVTYLFQVSLMTMMILLQFGENPREAKDRAIDEMDSQDYRQAISMGLVYAFFLLPLPQFLQNKFCKAKFTKHSRFKEQHMEDANYQDTDLEIDQARENNPTVTNLKRDDDFVEKALQNEKIIMTDSCIPFKLLFILATWSFACYVMLYLRDQSPELSQAQDDTLFTTWVVAIVSSIFLHNPLRLAFATCMLESVVNAEKQAEAKTCGQILCSGLFIPLEAKKLYLFYEQVQEAKEEIEKGKRKEGFAAKLAQGNLQDNGGRRGRGASSKRNVESSRQFKEDM